MSKIYKDELGIYAKVGGYVARPVKPSSFKEGDKTVGKHFGGSQTVGMGKLPGRGEYQEYWKTYDPGNFRFEPWDRYY